MDPGRNQLPAEIMQSSVFTERHLNQLASVPEWPLVDPSFDDEHLKYIMYYYSLNPQEMVKETHIYAASLLDKGKTHEAWQVLLFSDDML